MKEVILLLACAVALILNPQRTTIRIPHVMGTDEITFDPSRVSPAEVRRWLRLSPVLGPDNGYLSLESIEQCVAHDPRYQGCGKEQESVNLHNAQLNIEKIRQRIDELDDPAQYPVELSEVVSYIKRLQSFNLSRNTRLFEFEKGGDVFVLQSQFEGLDPKLSCGTVLDQIAHAKSHAEASQLARFDWANCVWFVEREKIGEYPKGAWEKFLSAYGIREHDVPEVVDD